MTKKSKLLIGSTLLFLVIILFSFLMPIIINSNAQSQSTYMIITDDGYYAETTYYLTEQAYQDCIDNNNSLLSAKTAKASILNVNDLDEESEFVFAAVQTVCVYEQADDDGNIMESRLLTSEEI